MGMGKNLAAVTVACFVVTGCAFSKSDPLGGESEEVVAGGGGSTTGTGGTGGTTTFTVAGTQLKEIGVKLDGDFVGNGQFRIELLAQDPSLDGLADFLSRLKGALESIECAITSHEGLACTCADSSVTAGASGAIDFAINIDSSGSTVLPTATDGIPPSDPENKRLAACQAAVDVLATGENQVGVFDFGTRYCVSSVAPDIQCAPPGPCQGTATGYACGPGEPEAEYYGALRTLVAGGVTYRFANYTGAAEKEALKNSCAKATWASNNGTPLRTSLWEIMNDTTSARPDALKSIVLLSDGMPTSDYRSETEVCNKCGTMGIPVFAVGFGQASLKDPLMDPEAVEVLQRLATCCDGTYTAIQDVAGIAQKVGDLSQARIRGHLDTSCQIPGEDLRRLVDPYQTVSGKIRLKFKDLAELKEVLFDFVMPIYDPAPLI